MIYSASMAFPRSTSIKMHLIPIVIYDRCHQLVKRHREAARLELSAAWSLLIKVERKCAKPLANIAIPLPKRLHLALRPALQCIRFRR
jgi:hypothetical protein